MSLPAHLQKIKDEVEAVAKSVGLDFFETIFEMVDYDMMNEIASYGGFPSRYPHWRFGMSYESLSKGYRYGLQKIYELVINNDPCYAYLMDCNQTVDQKMVMAHVYGHSDFFKNNYWFSQTNRKMIDQLANHGTRVQRYMEKHGPDRVEEMIDAALSIEDLIDPYSVFSPKGADSIADDEGRIGKIQSKEYMDSFINPPEFMQAQKERLLEEQKKKETQFPQEPLRDVLLFLMNYAPLRDWERDVLSMIREESYYFAPQAQTKIMNEGWATFWHSKIMTEYCLKDAEIIDYADHHSGTVATQPGQLNPYKMGLDLFRDIEYRWDTGRFGEEYEACDDLTAKREWNRNLGQGLEKIFEVRKIHNDVTFIDTFLTEEFCREHKLFVFAYNEKKGRQEVASREFGKVKQQLLFQLTNTGRPFIFVEDANFGNRGELLLAHRHEGLDLDDGMAKKTLINIQRFWRRPVRLRSIRDGKEILYSFDGTEMAEEETDHKPQPEIFEELS